MFFAQVKHENDLYLRQLEAEGRGEELYGKDVTLIVPKEGFVVLAKEQSTKCKAYINMCSSEKVCYSHLVMNFLFPVSV